DSIQLERVLVVELERRVLLILFKEAVADHEVFDFRAHKAAERVIRTADDGFSAYVETCIDQDRAAGERLETAEQRMITRVGLLMQSLSSRGAVHVGYVWDVSKVASLIV